MILAKNRESKVNIYVKENFFDNTDSPVWNAAYYLRYYLSRITVAPFEIEAGGKGEGIYIDLDIDYTDDEFSIKTENDLVKLNFSKQFVTIAEEKEDKLISSLVYTLTSLENINKISIYIEGNILNKMPSGKQIPSIIDRSYGINQKYNVTNIKGSTKTTIYYLSKFKDYYYYVPFTLVNNENKEKIEIIIEELASKNVYETSLISYLKDTKEISYEIENNFISLNMSKKLFNDLYESNLIESVIYTINLSVKDNYTQKEVIYNIDNQLYKNYYI